jgi:uncharacterized protein YjbI with pentapeptide repeats
MELIEDKVFTSIDFTTRGVSPSVYEYCSFKHCDFSKLSLENFRFLECDFSECNFSNALFTNTSLQNVTFSSCKLIGIAFEECNSFNFSVTFDGVNLDHCTFYKMDVRKIKFKKSSLMEADFTEANCKGVSFEQCDMSRAYFDNTNLQEADFMTAMNYVISPLSNQIKGAKFSKDGVEGLLKVFGIVVR